MYSIDSLSKQFVRNVVGAALALLVLTVGALLAHIVKQNAQIAALNIRIEAAVAVVSETERRCAEEKDRLRQEQISFIKATSDRVEKLLKRK